MNAPLRLAAITLLFPWAVAHASPVPHHDMAVPSEPPAVRVERQAVRVEQRRVLDPRATVVARPAGELPAAAVRAEEARALGEAKWSTSASLHHLQEYVDDKGWLRDLARFDFRSPSDEVVRTLVADYSGSVDRTVGEIASSRYHQWTIPEYLRILARGAELEGPKSKVALAVRPFLKNVPWDLVAEIPLVLRLADAVGVQHGEVLLDKHLPLSRYLQYDADARRALGEEVKPLPRPHPPVGGRAKPIDSVAAPGVRIQLQEVTPAAFAAKTKALFGAEVSPAALADTVGAPPGSEVTVSTSSEGVKVAIKNERFEIIATLREGDCYLDLLRVSPDAPPGVGTELFASLVDGVRRLDDKLDGSGARAYMTAIDFKAAGGEGWNGYYTWTRLGADGQIPARFALALDDPPLTLQQLMKRPGGAEWWRKNGESVHETFDLRPESVSMHVLRDYLAAHSDRRAAARAYLAL